LGRKLEVHDDDLPAIDGTTEADQRFLYEFFTRNAMFLLGVEWPIVPSAICPATDEENADLIEKEGKEATAD